MTLLPTNIRLATIDDAAQLLAIYAPFLDKTAITFETQLPTVAAFQQKMLEVQTQPKNGGKPWLVCEMDGKIVGYAYASKHRHRLAYQWSVESSIYLHPDYHRKGIGELLYTTLFKLLKAQGFQNVYAGITIPNAKSVGFHHSFGFKLVGIYEQVGFKQGSWHDVGWWRLAIGDFSNPPKKIIPIQDLLTQEKQTITE